MKKQMTAFPLLLLLPVSVALSGEADVVGVAVRGGDGDSYDFSVTVLHEDTGWDHYANRWEIVGGDGRILGTRTLHHPHVHEQPFTRNLMKVQIPDGVERVTIRAHDSVHQHGGETVSVGLPDR